MERAYEASLRAPAPEAKWERSRVHPGNEHVEAYGQKLQLRRGSEILATAVRLPGTLWRIYWPGGEMTDLGREREVIRTVEQRYGLGGGEA